jgi:hypothetical protein
MMGTFSRGMSVKIPAVFRDGSNNYVEVDNVILSIEHIDNQQNKLVHDLPEIQMAKFGVGQYFYEYKVPVYATPGNYVVKIAYKPINGKSLIESAKDHFIVTEEIAHSIVNPDPNNPITSTKTPIQESFGHMSYEIGDLVTDREGNPIPNVHVNIFEKKDYTPKGTDNMKVGAAITGQDGKWTTRLPRGEYVFVYNAVGKRENREYRKV